MKTHCFSIAIAALSLAACATSEPPASTDAPVAKRPAGQENAPPVAWRAIGTEPFWGVRVESGHLVFTTPDDQDGRVLQASERNEGGATVYAGNDGGQAYALTITPGECSDGMSDRVFRFKAEFAIGDKRYSGCAAAAGDPWGE